MAPPTSSLEIADRAVALATAHDGDHAGDRSVLIQLAGDQALPLEQARALLVRRIRVRSDDYSATSGLSLLNAALSKVGKVDDVAWKPRKWRLPH